MQLPLRARTLVKSFLWLSRAKLVYARITLTRYTSFYFLFAVLSCLVLSALQGVILSDNTKAVNILAGIVDSAELPPHLTRIAEGYLEVCDGIPLDGATCKPVINLQEGSLALQRRKREIYSRINRRQLEPVDPESEDSGSESGDDDQQSNSDDNSVSSSEGEEEEGDDDDEPVVASSTSPTPTGSQILVVVTQTRSDEASLPTTLTSVVPPAASQTQVPLPTRTGIPSGPGTPFSQSNASLDEKCIYSLSWLEDGLHDAQREDAAILFSHFWMMTIGIMAILNESLPHLGAAFLAHIFEGAWAASRIQSTKNLVKLYRNFIVPKACNGQDFLGTWWEERLAHTIPIVVFNALTILVLGFFSWRLYRVYSVQTFSRVGASPAVHSMYKLLLFFSVGLQLASFFSVASAALWINKVSHGAFRAFASHWRLYAAAFGVFIVLVFPWIVLGWTCMRKERKRQAVVFFLISATLIGFSSVMFSSALYRAIFMRWQFFATITVTAFVLLIMTVLLGVLCRINFDKGLSPYLDVSETLEGADFTPVHFSRIVEKNEYRDTRNGYPREKGDIERNMDMNNSWPSDVKVAIPEKAHYNYSIEANSPQDNPFMTAQELRVEKGLSVFSDHSRSPIQLSSSPSIIRSGPMTRDAHRRSTSSERFSAIERMYDDYNYASSIANSNRSDGAPAPAPVSRWSLSSKRTSLTGTSIPYADSELRPESVVSQLEHPRLMVANPDAYRESLRSSVAPTVLPPVPIPTSTGTGVARSGSVRGMAPAFPVVPRRITENH